jgi:hypothetical protein
VVLSINDAIVNRTKFCGANLFETLKCPLIVDVESSIVCRKLSRLVELSSVSLMYKLIADEIFALLNLNLPVPGFELVVAESKV